MILVVIDMQKGLVDEELYDCDAFVERVVRLIGAARDHGVEVLFVQHDAGPDSGMSTGDEDFELVDEVAPAEGERVFVKTINSSFGNKDFAAYLEQQADKRLMIVGLQTDFCIDATVKSAFERGYEVIVPEGTNSTFDNDCVTGEIAYRYFNEEIWPGCFADCVTFEDALELLGEKALPHVGSGGQ